MNPTLWLMLALAASGPATYGYMRIKQAIVVNTAVKAEREAGVVACNSRVAQIELKHNEEVARAVDEALQAANEIGDTPEGKELLAVCKRSASCRARGSL